MITNASDSDSINRDLKLLEVWENTWLLKFNTEKCKVMSLNFNDNLSNEYVLDGKQLERITLLLLLFNQNAKLKITKSNFKKSWP